MISIISIFFTGMFIGIANIVPGVSGGTIAVICNIYDKLIVLSSLNIKKIRQEWQSVSALLIGLLTGSIGFAKIITVVYKAYPVQLQFFFIGIIIGSVPSLYGKVKNAIMSAQATGKAGMLLYMQSGICGIFGLLLILGMLFLQIHNVQAAAIIPHGASLNTVLIAVLFFMGVISAFAMLIPGISGSFVLLILGAYHGILQAVSEGNIPLLIPFCFGVATGLIFGARLIGFLLRQFPSLMYGFILGLVAGSAVYLFPRVCQPLSMRIISIGALVAGYLFISHFLENKKMQQPAQK